MTTITNSAPSNDAWLERPPPHLLPILLGAFLETVLPRDGVYFVAVRDPHRKGMRHIACEKTDEMVAIAMQADAKHDDVYFACASYREKAYIDAAGETRQRTQENVKTVRDFWVDIDCGEQKAKNRRGYATPKDAERALDAFLKTSGLPEPAVVNSGGGLHLHWSLTTSIHKDKWSGTAHQLKALFESNDPPLLVDPTRTADVASIMRLPGTHNWKPERGGAEVKLLRVGDEIDYDEFVRRIGPPTRTSPKSTASERELLESADFDAEIIIRECQQFAWAKANQGHVREPVWRAMIGTLYRTTRPDIIHEFSDQHPNYNKQETERKANEWRGGGVTCTYLEFLHPAGCQGCPHAGAIRSPASLGFIANNPEPQNLFQSQSPQPLDLAKALPVVLAEFAAVRATVAGHDPTAYAYATIAAVSGVIPHTTRVELGPNWREPLLQWVAEVGPTGSGKTPAMKAAVEPVSALHVRVQAQYRSGKAVWMAGGKKGPPPICEGYYFTDPTIDALIDRAANAPHAVLRHADEGTSWLNAMGRYAGKGDGGERGTWLAGWNGNPYTVTRIERGDSTLDAWSVALLYGITPSRLKDAYADASSDGMLARTLICLTDPGQWVAEQPHPHEAAVTAAYGKAVQDASQFGALIKLSPAAVARWQALRANYRLTAQAVSDMMPGLSGFLVKAPTMAARLAGLFAVIERAVTVSEANMERAEIFIQHATMTARIAHEQVFAVSQPVAIARRLAARILTQGGSRITRREFERTDAFSKAIETERGAAIDHLAGNGWLLETDSKRVRLGPRFREATAWRVNPLVHVRFADIAARERKAAEDALARLGKLCAAAES
ncbi:MAG TPA: DUF3987 domain-containing protein [Casimicrobiaceae bacterium]|nr:DUF3987 domain-containing protein [Casimicrobiaceae bacterium]